MKKLYLYTAFHANLFFSSIPREDYQSVLDNCYWPLLQLADELSVPLGIEMSGHTAETLNELDPLFIRTARRYLQHGKIEILGSGYTQAIYPLIPAAENLENLRQGNAVYDRVFGKIPKVAYVNEQVFSQGLTDLYAQAGYTAIMMDWSNPNKYNHFSHDLQYAPQLLRTKRGTIRILWNHSIAFQKFQRYVSSELTLDEYLGYVSSHGHPRRPRAFLLYGSDLEYFDFEPGKMKDLKEPGAAFEKIRQAISALQGIPSIRISTPSEVLRRFPNGRVLSLTTSEYPIPCKKQDKYNLTRWAVTGRCDTLLNTMTWRLSRDIEASRVLEEVGLMPKDDVRTRFLRRSSALLHASDFRTHAVPEKLQQFFSIYGAARQLLVTSRSFDHGRRRAKHYDLELLNPNDSPWRHDPLTLSLHFPPGRFRTLPKLQLDAREPLQQYESATQYRDGSIRDARLVVMPAIGPYQTARGVFVAEPRRREIDFALGEFSGTLKTPSVELSLLARRGGTIRSLCFPTIAANPLLGHVPHGHFEDISLSPDFYSGLFILVTRDGQKLTDLVPVELKAGDPARYPIRVPITTTVRGAFGTLQKTYYVYQQEPRVDIRYEFRLNPISPHSFRVGIVTFLPKAFHWPSTSYSTTNGGYEIERFALRGRVLRQDEPVSTMVSSQHCLGETEGWIDIADREKGVSMLSAKHTLFSVPLLRYEEVDRQQSFMRILPTIAESDDTPGPYFWGAMEKELNILGHAGGMNARLRQRYQRCAAGLVTLFNRFSRAEHEFAGTGGER